MFTGIIEEVGEIAAVEDLGNGRAFRVRASRVLDGIRLGDSVSIDGACQTVTEHSSDGFSVQSVGTTLERTTLGSFEVGRRVNLERALAFGERLGGHLVQGHVDGVGEVLSVTPRDELVLIDFRMPARVAAVTVLQGSITVNGISLTVNALPEPETCQVSIIPFTWEHTALADVRVGDGVNLEGDMIGKYVRHLLGAPGGNGVPRGTGADLRGAWGY